jgi:hypothetical protein
VEQRVTLVGDPRLLPLRGAFRERLSLAGAAIAGPQFTTFLDAAAHRAFRHALRLAGAHEGTIWLVDTERTQLVPVLNTGPNATQLLAYRQPLDAGMISMVFATGSAVCEHDVYRNAAQDKSLDRNLGTLTCGMIAVPLRFAEDDRGIVSCVRLKPDIDAPDPASFSPDDLEVMTTAATTLGGLVDRRLMALVTGLEEA